METLAMMIVFNKAKASELLEEKDKGGNTQAVLLLRRKKWNPAGARRR
jgi:hypothetical protein